MAATRGRAGTRPARCARVAPGTGTHRADYFHPEASFDEGGGGCIAHARRVQLPANCRVDYEQDCEYDPVRRRVVCTWQASTVSAIDVTDGNFAGCGADRAVEGREQLIGVKDHGTL